MDLDKAIPNWCVNGILQELIADTSVVDSNTGKLSVIDILDPCAGNGNILNAARQYRDKALLKHHLSFRGIESNKSKAISCRNEMFPCLNANPLGNECCWNKPDLIITSPPLAIANEIAKKSIREIKKNGNVAMFLCINFMSMSEVEIYKNSPPDIFLFKKRPFPGDTLERAWFVWGPGRGNRWKII